MSTGANNQNSPNKKTWLTITSVVVAAIIILGIAFIYIWQHIKTEQEKENLRQEMEQKTQQVLSQQKINSTEVKESAEIIAKKHGLTGTYDATGEIDYNEDVWSFTKISLNIENDEDGNKNFTAEVVTANDGIGKKAWWTCEEYEGVAIVKLAVEGKETPVLYQFYNSNLIAMDGFYLGKVEDSDRFDSEFVNGDANGEMRIKLSSNGSAEGEFFDTNPDSENNGTTFVMSGEYIVDGEYIDITLNTATTRFLKFRFNSESQGEVSGIAPVHFKKK